MADGKFGVREFVYEPDLWLPSGLEEVFSFFSDPKNLQRITPDWLQFTFLSPVPIRMAKGTLIEYRLRLHGFEVNWQTEITAWEPPRRVVDEQRRGPYRFWIHEHRFAARDGGTAVEDRIRYEVPGGWIIDQLFVRRDIKRIFEFRRKKLLELLG